jgi:hypothetical protein
VTSGRYQVVPDELRAHARTVHGLADDLTSAMDAANAATPNAEAFGTICRFFVPAIQSAGDLCRTQLGEAGKTVQWAASELRETSADYEEADSSTAADLRRKDR